MSAVADFAAILARFFTHYLMQQREASPHTIASYRDTFRLLVLHIRNTLGIAPQDLSLQTIDAALITDFLGHIESQRGNQARSRNARLAAIRSLFRYVAVQEPQHAARAQQILAIPNKRHTRKPVDYLVRSETEALLQAPDLTLRLGRRDHTLLVVMVQTGMRASEIIGLQHKDVHLDTGAHIRCLGKGRKMRCIPLRRDSIAALKAWREECDREPCSPVFVNRHGRPLTHDSLAYLLNRNLEAARRNAPSLQGKRVTPHTLRHTAAMELLHNDVDRATIALWLGHESVETTYIYLHSDLQLKERAMARTSPLDLPVRTYRPDDAVLDFLNSL